MTHTETKYDALEAHNAFQKKAIHSLAGNLSALTGHEYGNVLDLVSTGGFVNVSKDSKLHKMTSPNGEFPQL